MMSQIKLKRKKWNNRTKDVICPFVYLAIHIQKPVTVQLMYKVMTPLFAYTFIPNKPLADYGMNMH